MTQGTPGPTVARPKRQVRPGVYPRALREVSHALAIIHVVLVTVNYPTRPTVDHPTLGGI